MATRSLITLALLLGLGAVAHAQPATKPITIGIYAPSVEFASASARLAYAQGVAKAVGAAIGQDVVAQSYANYSALEKDGVDFAILDAQCYATSGRAKLLATANIGGAPQRDWALYSSVADMQSLRGKKLAFVATGCNDTGFVDNAMLDSEVDSAFFGTRVGKGELSAAVAEVASYKTAQAVFAPVGSAKGLTKLMDTGTVPNPAFVALGTRVTDAVVGQVAAAVQGYSGGGAIAGWGRPLKEAYSGLAGRMRRSPKEPIFAAPTLVRMDASDVIIDPVTLSSPAFVDVHHLFVRPTDNRLE